MKWESLQFGFGVNVNDVIKYIEKPSVGRSLGSQLVDSARLSLLVDTGLVMSEITDFESALSYATEVAIRLTGCEGVTIYEIDGDELHGLSSRNTVLELRMQSNPFDSFRIPMNSQTIAGFVASSNQGLHIRDVYQIPKEQPFTFNQSFDEMVGYRSQSMLVLPMCDTKGEALGVMQLINRAEDGRVVCFPEGLVPYVQALASQVGVVLRNLRFSNELLRSRVETVQKFIRASEFHDTDTGMHVERMSRFSALLYRKLGYSESECEIMRLGSMLHDVGKICIPDRVLKKPGKLDAEEWEIMKTHTTLGYEMLVDSESPFLQLGAEVALCHHEKWDGSGYPSGLKGEDIPLSGRIVAIADVFDALCSRRCYKASWPLEEVLKTLQDSAGQHFDPHLVKIFLENIEEVLDIQQRFSAGAQAPDVSALKKKEVA